MAKGKAKKKLNEQTREVSSKATSRFDKLQQELKQANNGELGKSQLEDLLNKLKEPIKLENSSISIEDCYSNAKYKHALPKGYEKAITMVGKAIKQVESFQPQLDGINKILEDFRSKIDSIGTHHPKAQQTAVELLSELEYLRDQAFHFPSKDSMEVFSSATKVAIEKAMPTLEKDLGWGDYLKNMLKEIVNTITRAVTVGRHQGFFTEKTSDAATSAEELDEGLQKQAGPKG